MQDNKEEHASERAATTSISTRREVLTYQLACQSQHTRTYSALGSCGGGSYIYYTTIDSHIAIE